MGTQIGAFKRAADNAGISLEKYIELKSNGFKKCVKCKEFKYVGLFAKDSSRYDGINCKCNDCRRVKIKKIPVFTGERIKALANRMKGNNFAKGQFCSKERRELLAKLCRERFSGSNNPNWKGRITSKNLIDRSSVEYKKWRDAVFERDNYTCGICKNSKGGNLNAHHIKNFAEFPLLRFDVDNGTTLCQDCHGVVHFLPDSYRNRKKRKK